MNLVLSEQLSSKSANFTLADIFLALKCKRGHFDSPDGGDPAFQRGT